jgi:hypothetical protein
LATYLAAPLLALPVTQMLRPLVPSWVKGSLLFAALQPVNEYDAPLTDPVKAASS